MLWSIVVEVRLYLAVFVLYLVGILKSKTLFNTLFFSSFIFFNFYPQYAPIASSPTDLHVITLFLIGSFYWMNRDSIYISPFFSLLLFGLLSVAYNANIFGTAYIFAMPYFVFCIAYMNGLSIFRRLGDYSYGIYLVGWPVQQIIVSFYPQISIEMHQFSSILISLILAIFSWHYIEKPSLNLKNISISKVTKNIFSRFQYSHEKKQ